MIFFGKELPKSKFKLGIKFRTRISRVSKTDYIPHYYLIFKIGHIRCWIGYNRLKRIIRDKLYSLDGKNIKYPIKVK